MSLLDEALAAGNHTGPPCKLGCLIDAGDISYGELTATFAVRTIKTSTVGRIIRNRGHAVTDSELRRHRLGACSGCRINGRFTS